MQEFMMTEKEALKWVADLFEEPPEKILLDTRREAIPAWDSLGVLSLMAGLDEKFNIVLSDAEIRAMRTAGDILQILRSNGKLN
jgi:acyl carrier protein